MNFKPLSPDLIKALRDAGDAPLPVIDPSNQSVYYVVGVETHQKAMAALRQCEDIAAVQSGIDDMEAGRCTPLDESIRRIEKHMLSRNAE